MQKIELSLKDPIIKTLLIIICVVVFAIIFCNKFIIKPHKEKILKLNKKLEHVKLEDEIAKMQNEINIYEKSLPAQKDPSWVLTQITELASQCGLDIESIEPLPVKQFHPYSYIPFKIKTTCAFGQLTKFIESIESSQYILTIESLKLESNWKYEPEVPADELHKEVTAGVEIVIGTIY